MSDAKIQIKNSNNRSIVRYLKRLYLNDRTLRIELNYVKDRKRNGQIYISRGRNRDYDIDWIISILKADLEINQSIIRHEKSKLVIC